MMRDAWCCPDEAANHHLPRAAAFWVIPIVSVDERSSLTQNLMQIHCSTCPVVLNVTATQYTCSLNSVYHPHWLVQWSRHCLHMCIPVHSPWLPGYIGYIDVMQSLLCINNGCTSSGQTLYFLWLLYSLCCTSHPHHFCNYQFVLFNSFIFFTHPQTPLPSGNNQNILCTYCLLYTSDAADDWLVV